MNTRCRLLKLVNHGYNYIAIGPCPRQGRPEQRLDALLVISLLASEH